jgi:hypothetical protein
MAIKAPPKRDKPDSPIAYARRWLSYEIPKREPRSLAFAFAIAAKGYGLTEDGVRSELISTGLFSEGSTTIERAIANAWGNATGEFQKGKSWPEPDITEVERIVAAYPRVTLDALRQSPRNRASTYTQAQIIEAITYLKQLVCFGCGESNPEVSPVETLLGNKSDLPKWEFIVANPMTKRSGWTKPTPDKSDRLRAIGRLSKPCYGKCSETTS